MNSGQPPPPPKERLRPTLQLKIKANSWNKGSAENLHELTWRRLFSFQLILVKFVAVTNNKWAIILVVEVWTNLQINLYQNDVAQK